MTLVWSQFLCIEIVFLLTWQLVYWYKRFTSTKNNVRKGFIFSEIINKVLLFICDNSFFTSNAETCTKTLKKQKFWRGVLNTIVYVICFNNIAIHSLILFT